MLRRRVRDGVILRLIGKWLNAGVMEQGCLSHPEAGSPQGGVISPVLSNVYLHEVLDVWFEQQVKPRLHGRAVLIRDADDALLLFASEEDARRVFDVLPKRFSRYGLTLHPEKTRLVRFRRPPRRAIKLDGDADAAPGTFDFLGFTHLWARSRRGFWIVTQRTARDRMSRALRRITEWCRVFRHLPLREQARLLGEKLRGHFAYYGITGNGDGISRFREEAIKIWRKWLGRRARRMEFPWGSLQRLLRRFPLPAARIVHRRVANP
jgi:hypothetical protein